MTIAELQDRIAKKEETIAKINKRIAKWSTGMNDEAKALASDPNSTWSDIRSYKQDKGYDPTVFNQDDWNKGPNIDELKRAYQDLAEAQSTLEKYKEQLQKESDFINSDKIPVIWDFLQQWKQKAYNFFVENNNEYSQLIANESEAYKVWKEQNPKISYYRFEKEYYENIHSITKAIHLRRGIDEEKLNKILDADVQTKYNDLIYRISEKAGNILDASNLSIGAKGEINGLVQGDKHTVYVETIGAGGYNIQIFHFRTLVKIVK